MNLLSLVAAAASWTVMGSLMTGQKAAGRIAGGG